MSSSKKPTSEPEKNNNLDELFSLRHDLHSKAELSGNESQTAEQIVAFLEKTEPDELITGVGGKGIIARFTGRGEGPRVMIRCELDALPIHETNELPYRSQKEGISHKCGHDGHMAIVAGVARSLEITRPPKGEVALLFQPSEETGEGAERILNDQKFNQVKPDYIFALHNLPGYELGSVIVKDRTFAAASVGFDIRLTGSTSHAAHPEKGNNPAMAVAFLIQLLSAVPQQHIPFATAAKVTIIQVKMGEKAYGTSPGEAEVSATLRTFNNTAMEELKDVTLNIAENVAHSFDLKLETNWVEPFSATVNNKACVNAVRQAARELDMPIIEKQKPFGWSEDFGVFTTSIPGALFGLGAGLDHPELHASEYDFPDKLISRGVDLFTNLIANVTR